MSVWVQNYLTFILKIYGKKILNTTYSTSNQDNQNVGVDAVSTAAANVHAGPSSDSPTLCKTST